MIFPKDFESKVGFIGLRQFIADKCESIMGKRLVDKISFTSKKDEIIKNLILTHEMKNLIVSSINLPQDSFYDIIPELKRSSKPGSFITPDKIYECGITFSTMRNIKVFFNSENDFISNLKSLKSEFCNMPEFQNLEDEIFRCIEKGGEIKDHASTTLYEIRREIESVSRSMHRIIRKVIDETSKQGFIEKDATPVLRDGHMVIPVAASNRRNISGILHDTSATGKTFFIEPAEVVEAGNRLKELKLKEEQEIIIILTLLTELITESKEEIIRGCELLSQYDFIRAKARFAIETGGEMPVIENEPELDWFHAVHPGLLMSLRKQGREVIPLSINLNKDKRILIISGPNAGGKSVTLKTVGCIQYMMQCGLLPSLYSNSHMGIFRDIFIDIGDEQSMENDLSTYSSHLSNMKFFLQKSGSHTLVLADEMGSGTEPQIGAALAQSVLLELSKSGCIGIITTHYQNLKVLGENEVGFINGAMLYDRQKLSPSFQLMIGQPGSSFALEIAGKIGLPLPVIEKAKEIVGSDYVDSEKFLLDIQRDRKYWKNKRIEIKEKENRLNKLLEEYEEKAEILKSDRSKILKDAKLEAKEILANANSQIERSIHEIRKSQAEKERAKEIRKELEEYKKNLEKDLMSQEKIPDSLKPLKHKSKKNKNHIKEQSNISGIREFQQGDYVRMEKGGITGKIISISGKKAEVAFGTLRMNIDTKNLEPADKPKEAIATSSYTTSHANSENQSRERQLNFKQEIDVRGMRADEAIQAVTYFIDDALQFNSKRVRILHGTGHGILRSLIREYLQSNQYIERFYDEDVRFGGAGITVVELS